VRHVHSRMRKPHVSRTVLVVAPIGVVTIVTVILLLLGVPFDSALGVAGVLYGIVTLVFSEMRSRDSPTKSIVVLGIDDPAYTRNIVDGLRESVFGSIPSEFTILLPHSGQVDPELWQVEQLTSQAVTGADALVVLPVGDDPALWGGFITLLNRGVSIVVVDRPPPRELFLDAGLRPPPYVASDFVRGGRLAGEFIAEQILNKVGAHAILALGPGKSGPGVARSGQVLYALARRSLLGRSHAVELRSWDASVARELLLVPTAEVLGDPDASVVVFCGDDRILLEMQRSCAARTDWSGRIALIGYDGAQAVDGRLLVLDYDLALATVDTRPQAQGRAVGQVLLDAYHGDAAGESEERLVNPVLVQVAPRL
jgi:DNA-binding LacI/PurR family transcriptional regulator